MKDQYEFNRETLSMIVVPNFDDILSGLSIDVLALFGEKDTNVNWHNTKQLYESTIGKKTQCIISCSDFSKYQSQYEYIENRFCS